MTTIEVPQDAVGRGATERNVRDRIRTAYTFVALNWLTASILFAIVVLGTSAFYYVRDGRQTSWWYNPAALPVLTTHDADDLFESFYQVERNQYQFQPWVGFSERPFHSRLVNIDEATPLPLRRTISTRTTAAPAKKVIWLFGGSTIWGLGVPDDQTIASQLAATLSTRRPDAAFEVVNHAHCDYYSSQELALFQWLIRTGKRADIAIFIDGLNETSPMSQRDLPAFADAEREMFQRANHAVNVSPNFAPVRFIRDVQRRLQRKETRDRQLTSRWAIDAEKVLQIYSGNVRAARSIGDATGIRTFFFWQPTPYDRFQIGKEAVPLRRIDRHGHAKDTSGDIEKLTYVSLKAPEFVRLNRTLESHSMELEVHSLASLFETRDFRSTYVDSVHYGSEASRAIAERVADAVLHELPAAPETAAATMKR